MGWRTCRSTSTPFNRFIYIWNPTEKHSSLGSHCHVHSLIVSMFILQTFTTILAFLSFSVRAFSLSQLDVGAPSIIQPNASSVWPIGTQQIVIWYLFSKLSKSNNTRSPLIIRNTSNLPSDLINPVAQIILGFNKGNSLNLNFRECFFFNCYEFLAIITTTCDMKYCIHCCCSSLCATFTASKKSRIFL